MDQIPCPDGYLLIAKSPLADAHHCLNEYLVAVEEQGWKPATRRVNALRDKRLKFLIWMALLDRLEWHGARGRAGDIYFKQLHDLTYAIEEWKLTPAIDDLISALGKTAALSGCVMPYTPMPHLMAFVEKQGLTPELSAAVREFDAKVRNGPYSINQTRHQLINSRLDMLAWWDEWNGIDLKRCWSEQIRADYRSMGSVERSNWRRLLHTIQGDEGVRPAPSWLVKAEAAVQSIGLPAFRTQLLRWFEPLRPDGPARLSREGSFLLRSLIWIVPNLESPDLLGIVSGIPRVDFKPRKNAEKVIRAAAEISGSEYSPVKPSRPAPSLDALMARALSAVLSPGACGSLSPEVAGRVHIEAEVVHIRGDLDGYRVHISTGAIFRESDNQRVQVNVRNPEPGPFAAFNIGGISELLGQILILAEDTRHADAISLTTANY